MERRRINDFQHPFGRQTRPNATALVVDPRNSAEGSITHIGVSVCGGVLPVSSDLAHRPRPDLESRHS